MADHENESSLPQPAYTRSERKRRKDAIQAIIDEKKRKRKKKIKIWSGVAAFMMFLIYWGFMAPKASQEYAICRTFAEMLEIYPSSLKVVEIDPFDESMRITYLSRNPHGSSMAKMIECIFRPDAVSGLALDTVNLNREPFDDDFYIEKFNRSIPAIMAGDPDLSIPPRAGDDPLTWKRD